MIFNDNDNDDNDYDCRSLREGSINRKAQDKWRLGAKKALLQWVQAQVSRQLGVQVSKYWPVIGQYRSRDLNTDI